MRERCTGYPDLGWERVEERANKVLQVVRERRTGYPDLGWESVEKKENKSYRYPPQGGRRT